MTAIQRSVSTLPKDARKQTLKERWTDNLVENIGVSSIPFDYCNICSIFL